MNDKNMLAYFLLGHGTGILTKHNFEVSQSSVETLARNITSLCLQIYIIGDKSTNNNDK